MEDYNTSVVPNGRRSRCCGVLSDSNCLSLFSPWWWWSFIHEGDCDIVSEREMVSELVNDSESDSEIESNSEVEMLQVESKRV